MQCDGNKALDIVYGRLNDNLHDLSDDIAIDLLDEVRNLKLDLILWAMDEAHKNITQAAKMLNLNRTTMTSMVQNELAPVIKRRSEDRRAIS